MRNKINAMIIFFCAIASGIIFQLNHMLNHDYSVSSHFNFSANSFLRMVWISSIFALSFLIIRFAIKLLIKSLNTPKKTLRNDSLLHLIIPASILILMFMDIPNTFFYSNLFVFWISIRLFAIIFTCNIKEKIEHSNFTKANILFFSVLTFLLCGVYLIGVLNVQDSTLLEKATFAGEGILQLISTAIVMIALCSLTAKYLPRKIRSLICGSSILILPVFVMDSFLVRFMNLTIYESFKMMLAKGAKHFLAFISSLGVSMLYWAFVLLALAALVSLGYFLHSLTEKKILLSLIKR